MVYVHSVLNWAFWIIVNWLPKYMTQDLGLKLSNSAVLSALPFIMLAWCNKISGVASDALRRSGWDAMSVRKLMIAISGLIPAACLVLLSYIKNPFQASVL